MKVKKTCEAYREARGDYEIELDPGETVRISGEHSIVIRSEYGNVVGIRCITMKERILDKWTDLKIKRKIEVEG